MGIQIMMTAATKSFYRCLALGICVTKEIVIQVINTQATANANKNVD